MLSHAKLSASGAKKWLNCPGSITLEESIPNKSSAFSEEGTTAHTLGELKIKKALKLINLRKYNAEVKKLETDADMENYTSQYCDYVLERFNALNKKGDAVIRIEERLDLSNYIPEGFGTADIIIIGNGVAEVIDLKYGKGVLVESNENPQLKIYALGVLDAFDFLYDIEDVSVTVFQPRIDNIDTFTITVEDLLQWGELVKLKATEAFSGSDTLVCGGHYNDGFCRARAICSAYADDKLSVTRYDFKAPTMLSNDDIGEIIGKAEELFKWATLIKDYALEKALEGETFKGWKVVEGRSVRVFAVPDAEIGEKLSVLGYELDEYNPRKLLSLTGIEKLISKKTFTEHLNDKVIKPAVKPTLAVLSDKRPALRENVVIDFKDLISN